MSIGQASPRRFPTVRTLLVVTAAVVALGGTGMLTQSSQASAGKAHRIACSHHITVLFLVYSGMTVTPSGNGCWAGYRVIQNTSMFRVCHYTPGSGPTIYGNGPNVLFDDTNPSHSQSDETFQIQWCANTYLGSAPFYGEYLAYGNGTWEPNAGGRSISRYFTEYYSGANDVNSLFGQGPSGSNVFGTINIGPLRGNAGGLQSAVAQLCNATPTDGYMTLYRYTAGINFTQPDLDAIDTAINNCT
jgi:hypothetical protein